MFSAPAPAPLPPKVPPAFPELLDQEDINLSELRRQLCQSGQPND